MKFFRSTIAAAALLILSFGAASAQQINAQTGTSYTVANTDCSQIVSLSNASAIAVTLPQASSASGGGSASGLFMPPCAIEFLNKGVGLATITPTTSTIAGAATLTLGTGQSAIVVSDGTNYQVVSAVRLSNPLIVLGTSAAAPSHLASGQATAPAATSCGTTGIGVAGTDTAGTVTVGSSATTSCILTFNVAYTTAPHCVVSVRGGAAAVADFAYAVLAATITITQTSEANDIWDYVCVAPVGG